MISDFPHRREEEGVSSLLIEDATEADLSAMAAIYNQAVLSTTGTFDITPRSVAHMKSWFEAHGDTYPVIVARRNKAVAGWASLSAWSERLAYRKSAEVSFYVHERFRGKGIGKALLAALIEASREKGFYVLLSRVTSENEPSLHLHRAAGFCSIGIMHEVGFKFDRYIDVHMLELHIKENR